MKGSEAGGVEALTNLESSTSSTTSSLSLSSNSCWSLREEVKSQRRKQEMNKGSKSGGKNGQRQLLH